MGNDDVGVVAVIYHSPKPAQFCTQFWTVLHNYSQIWSNFQIMLPFLLQRVFRRLCPYRYPILPPSIKYWTQAAWSDSMLSKFHWRATCLHENYPAKSVAVPLGRISYLNKRARSRIVVIQFFIPLALDVVQSTFEFYSYGSWHTG